MATDQVDLMAQWARQVLVALVVPGESPASAESQEKQGLQDHQDLLDLQDRLENRGNPEGLVI